MNDIHDNKDEELNEQEDFGDDLYLIELHKRLAGMKKDRKKAEQDTNVLNNRLRLLKGEEEKVIIKYIIIYCRL
jgi:hypothetical protein